MIDFERTLVFSDFHGDLEDTNITRRKTSKHQVEILPLDWRIISMVRLVSQVLKNALNDYSFEDMSGAEVLDLMGYWRGCRQGFPQFGGPLWADFQYLELCLKSEDTKVKLLEFYKKFCETYGIKRIICGHTPFLYFSDYPGPRMKKIKTMEEEIGFV